MEVSQLKAEIHHCFICIIDYYGSMKEYQMKSLKIIFAFIMIAISSLSINAIVHKLPPLPYADDALAPMISKETISFHYGKHHAKYVDNLNNLIKGTKFEDMPLEDIIKNADGAIFNNAAQVWNHTFYWNSMTPKSDGIPKGAFLDALNHSALKVQRFEYGLKVLFHSKFIVTFIWS
jgi:hypothetical protein